jgi:small-conductance mechanosensitive channel
MLDLARLSRSLCVIGVTIAWAATANAQDPATVQTVERPAAESAAGAPNAPVIVDGVTLFRVRGVSALPAEQRATEIAARIAALGSDRTIPVESLVVRETALGSLIAAADHRVFIVTDADAQFEGLTRPVLAEVSRQRVATAVQAFRRDREAAVLWRNVGRAAMATVGFWLLLSLGRRVLRRLRAIMDRRYRSRIHDVAVAKVEIMRGDQLWRGVHRTIGIFATLVAVVTGYVYLNFVLLLFPWTRGLGRSLAGVLLRPLATLGTGFVRFIPNFVFLIVLVLVMRFVGKLVRLFFQGVRNGTIRLQQFEPEWALPTERVARIALVVVTLVIAYPYIPGSGSDAFKGIGIIVGLMFSLGSPSVIGNLVAGLSLAFRGAFKVGDRVRIGEHVGEVAQVRLLTTSLRTPKNEQIVIPNSLILNSEVVNFSTLAKDAGLILHTNVGIGYETPWRQVEAMLLESARRTPGLCLQPEPFVLQKALGDFAVDYELNVYCDDTRAIGILYSALHRNILDVFNEYGVQIMTPAYEGDPKEPKLVPRDQWFSAPAKPPTMERVVEPVVPPTPADVGLTTRPDPVARAAGVLGTPTPRREPHDSHQ